MFVGIATNHYVPQCLIETLEFTSNGIFLEVSFLFQYGGLDPIIPQNILSHRNFIYFPNCLRNTTIYFSRSVIINYERKQLKKYETKYQIKCQTETADANQKQYRQKNNLPDLP